MKRNMEWIDVNIRLPEEDGQYLTYMMDNGCCYKQEVQRFYNKPRLLEGMYADSFTHWEKVAWDDYIVTHWMQLPDSPKDDEDKEQWEKMKEKAREEQRQINQMTCEIEFGSVRNARFLVTEKEKQ